MSNPNYTLDIISHHPEFENKSLKKYYVEGIETIGAWGDEPFEIRFKNNTYQKVQVKLTLDGTDILTGEPATTEPTKDMWVVNGYGTLTLKAWPETTNGGSAFVFTNADKSVAVHTHGDLSNRGIIAAAVYTEGHVERINYNPYKRKSIVNNHHYHYSFPYWIGGYYGNSGTGAGGILGGGTLSTNSITMGDAGENNTVDYSVNYSDSSVVDSCKNLESLVSVGAGQHVDQKITYVAGLIKPVFTESIRIKYVWWDLLVESLKKANAPLPHPSGFPKDTYRGIDLKNTPRIDNLNRIVHNEPIYSRF